MQGLSIIAGSPGRRREERGVDVAGLWAWVPGNGDIFEPGEDRTEREQLFLSPHFPNEETQAREAKRMAVLP